jgi:hypothetical protein
VLLSTAEHSKQAGLQLPSSLASSHTCFRTPLTSLVLH